MSWGAVWVRGSVVSMLMEGMLMGVARMLGVASEWCVTCRLSVASKRSVACRLSVASKRSVILRGVVAS